MATQRAIMPQLGRETEIRALGQTWLLGRWTVAVWDRLLEWARPRLPDPFAGLDKIIDRVPPELAHRLISEAQEKAQAVLSIQSPLVQHLIDQTVEGQVQVLYELLREHQPQVTRDQAMQILTEIGAQELERAKARAAGEAPAGPNAPSPAA